MYDVGLALFPGDHVLYTGKNLESHDRKRVVSCPDPTPHGEEKGSGCDTTSRSTLEDHNLIPTSYCKQMRGKIA